MGKRAIIYCRISLDATGEGLGVARQEQACRDLCEQRGWHVTEVVIDNSVSASTRKVRPGWRKVLDLITSGAVDVVVAWQVDRMYRNLRDLEDLVDLTERTGVTLCRRPVNTPRRRPYVAPLVARDLPVDGQIPPR
ncbi:recombinase family protein, partial [Micromonospora tulbaghiae]|uniref:recombinase family protein n=1 Tax=Micromonospora tulbaghiae TaxID=479978 RepID=UPI00368F8EF1